MKYNKSGSPQLRVVILSKDGKHIAWKDAKKSGSKKDMILISDIS